MNEWIDHYSRVREEYPFSRLVIPSCICEERPTHSGTDMKWMRKYIKAGLAGQMDGWVHIGNWNWARAGKGKLATLSVLTFPVREREKTHGGGYHWFGALGVLRVGNFSSCCFRFYHIYLGSIFLLVGSGGRLCGFFFHVFL